MTRQLRSNSITVAMGLMVFLLLTFAGCGDEDGPLSPGGSGDDATGPVVIDPDFVAMTAGASKIFTATVTGHSDSTVTWSIVEGDNGGLIDEEGFYIAPGWPGQFHVVATSNANPALADTAEVAVSEAWECDENSTPVEEPYQYDSYFHLELCYEELYDETYTNENPHGIGWYAGHLWVTSWGKGYLAKATDEMSVLGWFGLGFNTDDINNPHDGFETYTGWHGGGTSNPYDVPVGGGGPGQFAGAADMDVDGFGNIFVACGGRIQRLDSGGNYVSEWNTAGPEEPGFVKVYSLAASEDGFVYAADSYYARIHKFSSDGSWIRSWGELGSGPGQFAGYLYLDVDAQGTLYVSENAGHRVQKFDGDGNLLGSFGQNGTGPCDLKFPRGISVDPWGFVLVLNTGTVAIKKFTADGGYITEWPIRGSGYPEEWMNPYGLTTDDDGNVYVVDYLNDNVMKFTR